MAWPSPWGQASTGTCLEGEGRRHRPPKPGRYRQLRGETGGQLPEGCLKSVTVAIMQLPAPGLDVMVKQAVCSRGASR